MTEPTDEPATVDDTPDELGTKKDGAQFRRACCGRHAHD